MWLNSSAYTVCIKYRNTHIHTALEKLITLEFGPSHCLQLNSSILRPWRTPTRTLFPSPLQLTVFHNFASDELWKKKAVIWHSTSQATAKRLEEYPQLQQNFYHTHMCRETCAEKSTNLLQTYKKIIFE